MENEKSGELSKKKKIFNAVMAATTIGNMALVGCAKNNEERQSFTEKTPESQSMDEKQFTEFKAAKFTVPSAITGKTTIIEEANAAVDLENDLVTEAIAELNLKVIPEILYKVVDKVNPVSEEYIEKNIVPNLMMVRDWDNLIDGGYGFPVQNENTRVNCLMQEDLVGLINDAYKQKVIINVKSGFRSFIEQQHALNMVLGDTKKVAKPGESQHQLGLAIDFSSYENKNIVGIDSGFNETQVGKWLVEHAWEYGFVNSYVNGHDEVLPEAEGHHYIYVGKDISKVYEELKQKDWEGDIFDLQSNLAMQKP